MILTADSEVQIDATGDMWGEVGFTPAANEYPFYACYSASSIHTQSDMYTDGTNWGYMGGSGINIIWEIKVPVEDQTGIEEEIGVNINPGLSLFSVGNVFNLHTEVIYSTPSDRWIELRLYDISGREVRTLVDRYEKKGTRSLIIDRRDNNGSILPAGQYFCRLSTKSGSKNIKIVFVE